jgi:asparagine synthase (glutamine-hydrolysing)
MCGIFGYISFNEKQVDRERFDSALKTIAHRGPDFQKSTFYDDNRIGFGHARLSVIDLSECANQPMQVDKYEIVFNGEIYNYIEIRETLIANGYTFSTASDTEVLVKAYDCWGEDCVNRFNGMWAFVIFNREENTFFCSRDRFGVKPFNYYTDDDRFIFGSEIKPIINYDTSLRQPDYNAIGLFCREGICGQIPETWFKNIFRLLPAHNLVIKNNKVTIYRYYSYPSKIQDISFEDAKKQFADIFTDAVKLRMRSDVPVGATLSGGLDSTSIVATVRQFFHGGFNTFTAHFPEFEKDESEQAAKTNEYYHLTGNAVISEFDNRLVNLLKKAIYHLESGHPSPAILPLWKIHAEAKKVVTVVLEGQGADELLGGYIEHIAGAYLYEKFTKFQFRSLIRNYKQLVGNYSSKTIFIFFLRLIFPSFLRTGVRKYLLKTENVLVGKLGSFRYTYVFKGKSDSYLTRMLQQSHNGTLVNLLHYGDAISMAFAIESRLPFMDYRLVDFVMTLPADYLIANGKGKFIQRKAMESILPDFINRDVKKLGFGTPINRFFTEDKDLVEEILLDNRTLDRGIFDKKELKKLIHSNFLTSLNRSNFMFRLLSVELWFRMFIDEPSV